MVLNAVPLNPLTPSREQAEQAVKTLIAWTGDNPNREGLIGTPERVVRAYEEYFMGYQEDPKAYLQSAAYDADNYDDMVVLRDIRFESHCEHHIAPIIGTIHLAYVPHQKVVGISKLARVCDVFAKRLQIQEALTAQIAHAIDDALDPKGVAVLITAGHDCMTTRGVHKTGMSMVTRAFKGIFKDNHHLRQEFLGLLVGHTT
jgi:GTP cyclohydrolase IA